MNKVLGAIDVLSAIYKETTNSVYNFRSQSFPEQILTIDKFIELLREFKIVGESDVYYDLDDGELFICNHYKGQNCVQHQNMAAPKIAEFIKYGTISGVDEEDGLWKWSFNDGKVSHLEIHD